MSKNSLRRRRTLTGLGWPLPALALAAALVLTGPVWAPAGPTRPQAMEAAAPAPVEAPSSSYAFMNTAADGSPFTYDPCRPIHYVTRTANEPPEGPRLIQEAIAAVSLATGQTFINDGTTDEAPSPEHVSFQPDRYGDRWAPVLIAWSGSDEEPRFHLDDPAAGIVLGIGGSEALEDKGSRYTYVSGQVSLNGPGIRRMIKSVGTDPARGLIAHELGHLVGLDHVADPAQLMNPQMTPGVTSFQPGDLAGLARLGQGDCRPGL